MTDYNIKVTSDIQDAEKKLDKIDKLVAKVEKPRNLKFEIPSLKNLEKGFTDLEKNVVSAANNVRKFYDTTKNMPVIGDVFKPIKETEQWARKLGDTAPKIVKVASSLKDVSTASGALETGMRSASNASDILITRLAKVGFSLFALKEGTNILKAAFGGFFNETIGRQVQLEATILKTQTTLASTNKVFKNGAEVTDPYQKIVSLTGEIGKNIDSIRTRSIELAGVTSNDVIEVFGIVAGQISQIGGGLKEAEDLAINFAAALGTFGLPLYQARQEIGSILRGDITMDSYLAKSLGITNKDIADAKNKAGGVVAFLQDRLSAAVAGQRIAAQGFNGVLSNIKDLQELIGQKFGAGLLAPLIGGLTKVFDTLFKIRGQVFGIAESAGKTVGNVLTAFTGQVKGRVSSSSPEGDKAVELATKAQELATKAFTAIEQIANRTVGRVAQIIKALAPTVDNITQGLMLMAKTFVQIKVATFENLLTVIANLTQIVMYAVNAFSGLFTIYAALLNQPFARYISEIATTMALLKRAGLDTIFTMSAFFMFVKTTVGPVVAAVAVGAATVIAAIGAIIASIGLLMVSLAGVASAFITPLGFIRGASAAMAALSLALRQAGADATRTSGQFNAMSAALKGAAAGAKGLALSLAASIGGMLALQIAITVVVDLFGRWQRAQEDAASDKRAELALLRLGTTYKDVGDNAGAATIAARDFERTIVNANFNKAIQGLEDVRKKINDLKYDMNTAGVNSMDELLAEARSAQAEKIKWSKDTSTKDIQKQNLAELERQKVETEVKVAKIARALDKERAVENIKIQADNAKQLAKDQKDLDKERIKIERDHKDKLFQMQQQIDGKAIDIFRVTSEIAIRQVELRNKKLIEGETGTAAAALNALNEYISTKKKAELNLETTKRQLQLQAAELDKSVIDYRLSVEERILAMKEKIGKYEMDVANYLLAQKQNEAAVLSADGQNGVGNVMPGGVVTPGQGLGANRGNRSHEGQDIGGLAAGARINARLAGTIINVLKDFGDNGDAAVVKYDNGEQGTYGHIKMNAGMGIGSRVGAGGQLGVTANTPGYVPHLHYELRSAAGKLLDPLNAIKSSLAVKGNAAMPGGGNISNMYRFLNMVAQGESGGDNSQVNPASGTVGRFQFKDSTRTDALQRGLLSPTEAANLISDNKNAQYAAVSKYIRKLNPTAAANIDGGNFGRAEELLSGALVGKGGNQLFTSLRGGGADAAKEGSDRRKRMDAALGGGGSTPAAFALSRPVMDMKNIPTVQDGQYKAVVNTLKDMNEQFAAVQAKLADINTKEQFDGVLKNLYPKRELQQYKDTLVELREKAKQLAAASNEAYDPELLQISVEEQKALILTDQQRETFLKKYATLKGVTAAEVAKLANDEAELHGKYVESVREEFKLKREILGISRATAYIEELKVKASKAGMNQELAVLQLKSQMAGVLRDQGDFVGARLGATNLQIEQDRVTDREKLQSPEALAQFEANAAALRESAVALGEFDEAIAKVTEKLAMAREAAGTFVSGFKGVFKAALSGGDIGEAVKSFTEGLTSKFLDMFADYAFKPLEKQMEKVFAKLFGVDTDNPVITNTSATVDNTTALVSLTTAISSAATGASNNIVPGPQAIPVIPFGGGFSPESAFGIDSTGLGAGLTGANLLATESSEVLSSLTQSFREMNPVANQAATGMQNVLGGITTLAAGAGAIFGGISQMGQGGTGNILSGLSGIFGAIGGIAGSFAGPAGIAGLFKATGGPVLSNKPYIVGEMGPEIFMPNGNGSIVPNDKLPFMKSGDAAGAGGNSDWSSAPGSYIPFSQSSSSSAALIERSNRETIEALTAVGPLELKVETQSINNVEYVTVDQHRRGMSEASNRGRELTLSALQNSVRTRRRAGL